jgi:hypothetical protein
VKKIIVICVVSILSACVASPIDLTPTEQAVRVYTDEPDCEYENLGLVSAQSGSVSMDIEGNEAATLSKLKKAVAAVGANAVIVLKSETGDRQWHSSGVQHQMSGTAIRCK